MQSLLDDLTNFAHLDELVDLEDRPPVVEVFSQPNVILIKTILLELLDDASQLVLGHIVGL